MQKIIKNALGVFIGITVITAFTAIAGIGIVWYTGKNDLPYLSLLMTSVLIEIVAVVIAFSRKGLKYLPDVVIAKEVTDTMNFMKDFFKDASSISIVSNRVSWLTGNEDIKDDLVEKLKRGIRIEIFTPNALDPMLKEQLKGIIFYETNEETPPDARFTLINGDRGGCERLAIARGNYPEHEITTFDGYSGPQMISMAKDIVKKCKEQSNAS